MGYLFLKLPIEHRLFFYYQVSDNAARYSQNVLSDQNAFIPIFVSGLLIGIKIHFLYAEICVYAINV